MGAADVLVIGGGVFGLSVARSCAAAGLRVVIAEAEHVGAGASGGLVGALTPHRPGQWRDFKQFQLEALASLPQRMAALAQETGIDPGYARTGRLVPLTDAGQRERAEAQVPMAAAHWGGAGRYEVLDAPPPGAENWLAPAACPFGVTRDTLSAQVAPRRYLAALKAALATRVELLEGWHCIGLDTARGVARFDRGEIAAGHMVVAAGTGAVALLEGLTGRPCGSGVKGQAALLDARAPQGLPVIQGDGLFVVAHAGGVAVGSTSEKTWDAPGCDGRLDDLVERARTLCPALTDAPVGERWAGIRPKAPGNEPMVGPLPDCPRVIVATGGYRIGLALAHAVGDAVAAAILGATPHPPLPAGFAPAHHLGAPAR